MRDYRYTPDDGPPMLVTKMPTAKIHELLANGIQIVPDGDNATEENVRERLRIELLIRELGF